MKYPLGLFIKPPALPVDIYCRIEAIFVTEKSFAFWGWVWYSFFAAEKEVILYGKGEGYKADCTE